MDSALALERETVGTPPVEGPAELGGAEQASAAGSRPSVLNNRNFRLRLIGGMVSCLGDQFYMIALPWLVLQLTGNAFAMGSVLALAGVPRALFMLVGGAMTDRISPRAIMIASNLVRLLMVGLMALLVLTGAVELWMLYVFALIFGLADAFFYPAVNAILPQIVEKDQLQAGNSIFQGTLQVAIFLGPILAGALIATLGGGQGATDAGSVADQRGLGVAFAINCCTFLFSVITLWMMRIPKEKEVSSVDEGQGLLASIREVLVSVWNDEVLKVFFLIVAAINFMVNGPFIVGIPVFADSRFGAGSAGYGIIMGAGGGSLLGIILAGVLPRPSGRGMSLRMLLVTGVMGIGMCVLGLATSTFVAAADGLVMGATGGYVSILFMTWLQARTPQAMLGRVMSLLMFAAVGLMPISIAIAGALIDWNATALFEISGALVFLIVVWGALNPRVRNMSFELDEQPSR